jgi:hypothetical protein
MAGDDSTARQARTYGPGWRVLIRGIAVLFAASPLALPAVAIFGELDLAWWAVALIELGAVIMAFLGLWAWFEANRAKADLARLRHAGRPAVAEILKVEVTDPGDGTAPVATLSLRISGTDVPPFEAEYCTTAHPRFAAGTHLDAIVDPADNLFTLDPVKPQRRP